MNLERFEKFMERLSLFDMEQFEEVCADLKYFEGKTGRRPNELERHSYKNSEDSSDTGSSPAKPMNKDLAFLIKATEDAVSYESVKCFLLYLFLSILLANDVRHQTLLQLIDNSDEEENPLEDDSDEEICKIEFVQHKRDYYMNKMEYQNVDA